MEKTQLQRDNLTRVLITGADGFLGKNLLLHLNDRIDLDCRIFKRGDSIDSLPDLVSDVDFVFHLAGVNRPQDVAEYEEGNAQLTRLLVAAVDQAKNNSIKFPTIIFASSIQAELDNPYGKSKRLAEQCLFEYSSRINSRVYIFRFPNIFGKWARPNFNSVVATFCHNISRNLPIQINDPDALLSLVYVDDVMDLFLRILDAENVAISNEGFALLPKIYEVTVGALAKKLRYFRDGRRSLWVDRVGAGFMRALYSTYISYLPVEEFSYDVTAHSDSRGSFVEMIKTPDCGQISYFTAHPGVTRGGHYHHSKIEKFLVIKGHALFRFRHMQTGQIYQLESKGDSPKIIETIPGWTHDVTNIGADEMIAVLWANEVFDPLKPDTHKSLIQ